MRLRVPLLLAVALCACPPGDPPSSSGGGAGGGFGGSGGSSGGAGGGSGGGAGGGQAGGGGTGGGAATVSGTRLKARLLRSPDGQEVFYGWRDTQSAADCVFRVAEDGAQRCVPTQASYVVDVFFADAQCTTPVYRGQTCLPPRVLYRSDQSACPARSTYVAVGAALPQRQVYLRSGATCLQIQLSAQEALWAVGAPLAPSSFVRGTVAAPAGTSGVGLSTLVAEDGARQSFGFRDLARNADCSSGVLEDGATHCFPSAHQSVNSSSFADTGCTAPALQVAPSGCAPPDWAVGAPAGCSNRFAVYSRGAELTRTYYGSGGQCTEQALPAQHRAFAVTPVPASAFPGATRAPQGSGRLQRERVGWPGGLSVEGDFFDTHHSSTCSAWYTAADGQRRCLPTFASSWYFADAACTQHVAEVSPACTPAWGGSWDIGACGAVNRVHLHPLGARHTGALYSKGSGACLAVTGTPGSGVFHLLGAEVPPTDFVAFTEVVR